MAQGKVDEAIACYKRAIAIDPTYIKGHKNLGKALWAQGKAAEAVAIYQKAIKLQPDDATIHNALGLALRRVGKLADAVAAYRKAIELKPDNAEAYSNLGIVWQTQRKLVEAIRAFRKAIELKPDFAEAYSNLGVALRNQGKLDEAVAAFRKASELGPEMVMAHCNLGHALREQGRFAEALAAYRRGHELVARNPRLRLPTDRWVRAMQRLPRILQGEAQPANAAEAIELARLCQDIKKQYAAAARFYAAAFAAQPKLAEKLGTRGGRYDAACAAALAGCGQGKDAANLDDKERSSLRKQALAWLQADLEGWRRLLEKDPDKARPLIVKQMQHWLTDPDLAGVRGPKALASLPESERPAWQKLWTDVADRLARAKDPMRKDKEKPDKP
jgi:Flp pilus assembly protein TadD